MRSSMLLTSAVALLVTPLAVQGSKQFLKINNKTFMEEILEAMGPMFGCGGEISDEKAVAIHKVIDPMWKTLPKVLPDRVDRRSLRHLAHRYFMKTSNLMVRGFEPTRLTNDSHWGVADVLSQFVPAYVEAVLESQHKANNGFDLPDAIHMIVMLEQLILDSERTLLEKAYTQRGKPRHHAMSQKGLAQVLEEYMIRWIVEGDEEDYEICRGNRSLMNLVVPHWDGVLEYAESSVKSLSYNRFRQTPKGHAKTTWEQMFTFEDALAVVGDVTQNMGNFWRSECDNMKDLLVAMDTHHTGRASLSKIYSRAIDSDWRFGESEGYLRELGALDESSSTLGPQVIIPNYLQAASNCIVSTPHYMVCCQSECEAILGEIESAIQAPTASVDQILDVVGNMTTQTNIDEEYTPELAGKLTQLLEDVAASSGGMVPLHGRLFAQWLHYVFPRECAFPHKAGVVSMATPTEYGEDYVAEDEAMRKHVENGNSTVIPLTVAKDEINWMSQWSPDEELIGDYSAELGMSWRKRTFLLAIASLFLFGAGILKGTITVERKSTAIPSRQVCYV